jgi:hypothetical protein
LEQFCPSLYALEAASSNTIGNPRTIHKAKQSTHWPEWLEAMNEEIRQLEQRKTWIFSNPPKAGTNIVNTKWVYRTKRNAQGNITLHRAQLVARGFTQQEGLDYFADNTFAAVAKLASVRLLLGLAAQNSWSIHQMDVKSAYLYGKLSEDKVIYLKPPPGITLKGISPGQVL